MADVGGTKTTFQPRLLVGCDGLGSGVRQTLHEWEPSGRYDKELGILERIKKQKPSVHLFQGSFNHDRGDIAPNTAGL